MTPAKAHAFAAARLREIQANAIRHDLPDASWAEILIRTPDGDWTQAFRLSNGVASALTEPVWVPIRFRVAG